MNKKLPIAKFVAEAFKSFVKDFGLDRQTDVVNPKLEMGPYLPSAHYCQKILKGVSK